jgi:transglutaminase-like putative cysteine protease
MLWIVILDLGIILYFASQIESQSLIFSRASFFRVLKILGLSLPLWLIIFLFFPRFTLDLWGTGAGDHAQQGFTFELKPGQISRLVQTSEIAFRWEWLANPPVEMMALQAPVYFRGLALEKGQGLFWQLDMTSEVQRALFMEEFLDSLEQAERELPFPRKRIWHSMSHGDYLVGLDYPASVKVSVNRGIVYRDRAGNLRLSTSPERPFLYEVMSAGSLKEELSQERRRALVALDDELRERLFSEVEVLKGLKSSVPLSSEAALRLLIRYFKSGGFENTLNPPPVPNEDVIEFLNNTKKGFCEHFAGSLATLLRALGVPARIVMGYLGGRPDPFSNSFIMLTREAHAWVEYYDDNLRAWQRMDPTLWLAPVRVSQGADAALLGFSSSSFWGDGLFDPQLWRRLADQWTLFQGAYLGAPYRWALQYEGQWLRDLVGQGKNKAQAWLILMVVWIGVMLAAVYGLSFVLTLRLERNPWEKIWSKFLKSFKQKLNPFESELSSWQRVKATTHFNSQQVSLGEAFVANYLRARYGGPLEDQGLRRGSARGLKSLKKELRSLRHQLKSAKSQRR